MTLTCLRPQAELDLNVALKGNDDERKTELVGEERRGETSGRYQYCGASRKLTSPPEG